MKAIGAFITCGSSEITVANKHPFREIANRPTELQIIYVIFLFRKWSFVCSPFVYGGCHVRSLHPNFLALFLWHLRSYVSSSSGDVRIIVSVLLPDSDFDLTNILAVIVALLIVFNGRVTGCR